MFQAHHKLLENPISPLKLQFFSYQYFPFRYKVTKQDLGKSFKWLLEQGIVIDEKDLERARNDKGHFVADDPDTPENEAWVKKEEEE